MKRFIIILSFSFILLTPLYSSSQNIPDTSTELQKQDSSIANFVIEEYKLISAGTDTLYPGQHQQYRGGQYLGKGKYSLLFLNKRRKWREKIPSQTEFNAHQYFPLEYINGQLESFGYKFVESTNPLSCSNPAYDFYHGDKLLLKGLCYDIGCFMIDKKNNSFLFTAEQRLEKGPPYRQRLLIINGEVRDWGISKTGEIGLCPRLLNGLLMWVKEKVSADYKSNYVGEYAVMKNEQEIDSFSMGFSDNREDIATGGDLKSFIVKDDDWILEYYNGVIINGKNIGKNKGYDEVFNYQYIKDKPFYFFKKKGKIYMSYNNKIVPYEYDNVPHYLCCDPSTFDIRGNESMVWFYALKDGYWYYVEAGIFE